MAAKQKPAPFPSRDEILAYIHQNDGDPGEREIARAFRLKGGQRAALRGILKSLAAEGLIEGGRRHVREADTLPSVGVVEIVEIDADGELIARPVAWNEETPPPRILMAPDRGGRLNAGIGERMLARLGKVDDDAYEGRVIRRISAAPDRVLGVYEDHKGGGRLRPTDRKFRHELAVSRGDTGDAKSGELVLAEVLPGRTLGLRQARVIERLGDTSGPQTISLIAIHSHDIPTAFPHEAIAEAEASEPVTVKKRTDLRSVPLVTIDGDDARDFDDAVWAAPDDDTGNPNGFRLTVAIADVAHYVRPDSALDRAARDRGNSVYFPDRVVPMLPEALSNGLCSLRPGEDRGALACHMRIDAEGTVLEHNFERVVMRSTARLTYDQVQAAFDGRPDSKTRGLLDHVLLPLQGAYQALDRARRARQSLDLDLPERRIFLDDKGGVDSIATRPRHVSHKIIEEFMIAANVAAAVTLEKARAPCVYRIHDAPDSIKIEALRDFLASLDLTLGRGQVIKPAHLNRLLARVRGEPHERMLNELVLRTQSQAEYSPSNIGHFGLALARYAHFTSPIRRYADLIVHSGPDRRTSIGQGWYWQKGARGLGRSRPAYLEHRAPGRGGRARRRRPVHRRLPGRPCRRDFRRRDQWGNPLRSLHNSGRNRRRWPGPHFDPVRRLLCSR